MPALTAPYLFLLGLASGIALLPLTAYGTVSPRWLKWLLLGAGLFTISRYVTMALFTHPEAPRRFWALRHCWFASSIGLTLPSAVAVDQLLRHPAISPQKLLQWYAPFFIAFGLVILFGGTVPEADPLIGWKPHLTAGWRLWLSGSSLAFVVSFAVIGSALIRKVPVPRIRLALLALIVAQGSLGVNSLLLGREPGPVSPFLYSELAGLLALWYAYRTASALS